MIAAKSAVIRKHVVRRPTVVLTLGQQRPVFAANFDSKVDLGLIMILRSGASDLYFRFWFWIKIVVKVNTER